jgi:hypothetical protein
VDWARVGTRNVCKAVMGTYIAPARDSTMAMMDGQTPQYQAENATAGTSRTKAMESPTRGSRALPTRRATRTAAIAREYGKEELPEIRADSEELVPIISP